MRLADRKTTSPNPNLKAELGELSRELRHFNVFYTGFCDALAKILVADQPLDAGTLEGIHRSCHWLKHRLAELQAELEAMAGRS